jgi:type I restriction enzyme M protein
VAESGYDLDRRNPHRRDDLTHRPPGELVAELIDTERELLAVLEQLQREIKDFSA